MYNNYPYYDHNTMTYPMYQNGNDDRFVGLLGPALLGGLAGGLAGGYLAGPRYPRYFYPPMMPYGYSYGYGAAPYYRPF